MWGETNPHLEDFAPHHLQSHTNSLNITMTSLAAPGRALGGPSSGRVGRRQWRHNSSGLVVILDSSFANICDFRPGGRLLKGGGKGLEESMTIEKPSKPELSSRQVVL